MKAFRNKDEKIQYVLDSIDAGKDTDTIAKDLGYKNYKSLDMFMRREGYLKEKRLGNYYPKSGRGIIEAEVGSHRASVTSKALEIIQHFKEDEMSPKRIAHESGFETPKEMANYMKSKGFMWDASRNNYRPESGEDVEDIKIEEVEEVELDVDVTKYGQLLAYLDSRKDKIVELLEGDEGVLPRYVVPGIFITKSVHMSNQLDQMTRDFSADRNISQRDVFEVALIDFDQLSQEITRIAETTQFNTMNLLDGTYKDKEFHIGANKGQSTTVAIDSMKAGSLGVKGTAYQATAVDGIAGLSVTSTSGVAVSIEYKALAAATVEDAVVAGSEVAADGLKITITLGQDASANDVVGVVNTTKADIKRMLQNAAGDLGITVSSDNTFTGTDKIVIGSLPTTTTVGTTPDETKEVGINVSSQTTADAAIEISAVPFLLCDFSSK